jgi:uncharacterized protein (DUF427 family)
MGMQVTGDGVSPSMDDTEVRVEPNPRWVRGIVDGRTVIDSRDTKFVWTHPYYPAWYIPVGDVGDATLPVSELPEVPGHVKVDWDAVDHWFEEDVEVFIHPRDPYKRIDSLPSSRHVRVRIDGVLVADSQRPTILYETLLPARYYLPMSDVRLELLTPTETSTACPYKGWAHYWTADIDGVDHVDIAWGYRTPLPESEAVAGLVCFYNEKVDLEIDGEAIARPSTKFS